MSVADCRRSAKRMRARYGRPGAKTTVAQSIERERQKAARQAKATKKK